MVYQVGEVIPVLARFSGGRFEPTRFRWGGRTHRVGRVTGRWAEHDGQFMIYHFSLVSETDTCYEISFRTRGVEWTLDKILSESA